ncbi:MAG: prolyl oligopeptidase family serine peptidase [Deltaproteobacteria bacterium]|nr:prolyl oligopeptidase family serine peptidase [Deltaproteobacteria bacterium]
MNRKHDESSGESRSGFKVEAVHFPDGADCLFPADGVKAHCYRPTQSKRGRERAGVVVLPITAGDYEVSTMLTVYLARQGFTCLRMERRAEWLAPERTVEDLARLARQTPLDVGAGVDWFIENGGFDPDRLGVLGVSMGAMQASILAGTDPRVKAAVLVIGGAGLADLLLTADDDFINEYREAVSNRLGIPESDLGPVLHEALDPMDNAKPAGGMNPDTTLMFSALFDRVVRPRYGRRLWEAAGRPRRILLPCGHYSAEFFVPLILWMARRWFDRHLLD